MAEENLIQTNIVATSDMTSLIVDLNKVSSALALLQERLNASNKSLATQAAVMNRTFSETLRSTGQFSTHFVSLTSDVDKFGSQLDRGQVKLGQFFRVYGDHVKTSGGLVRELAQQQVRLQNSILQPLGRNAEGLMQYNVQIPRGLDITKNKTAILKQEMQILNKVVQEGAGQLINWGKNTQWAGRQLTVGLTVPMAAFGKAAADAFKTADEQLIRLTKVYGGLSATSAAELAKVRKDVQDTAAILAKSYGASFKDTLGLAADIAATGKQGNELLGSIQETTRLSVLGEVDRQDAMKATLAIQSAFKQNTKELTESINFLNAVENQTSTTLNDLVEAIPKAGPVVKGLGGDIEDLALYLTAMREGGINASEGANALKSGLASLINPTKVATGLFAGFGIDLKNIVTSNAGNLTNTLLDLQKALDTLDPLQKQQAIEQLFGKFQFSRMNALFENLGKQGSQTLQVLDLMKASSEDLANIAGRELAQVTESASGKYKRAVEGLKADLAGIGDQFLKINTTLINVVDSVIKFVDKLPQPIKQALAFMGMLTATAGPLIMLAGVLGNFFGYIIKGVYHFKALFKGAEGWKLLTPEILAANKAGSLAEDTFYNDARAAAILKQALDGLAASYAKLETRASSAAVSTNPTISTVAGSVVVAGGGARQVNTDSPYLSDKDTRSFSHMEPVAKMSTERKEAQTFFGVVPGAPIVNQKIGANPQIYMEEDLPKIPGLTSIRGVSTGVVSEEAAKWHSMSAALAMQSESEIALLKKEVATTGLVTSSLSDSYQAMLPEMTRLTSLAATESKLIVAELQQGKITVDQARAKIIALNAQIESMMAQTASTTAAGMGRTIDVTRVPLLDQPVVNPISGKSNMKELMKPGRTRTLINNIARVLGVKTYGAPYSIETTIPKRLNTGGDIEKYGAGNTIVSGPSSINYDDRMGRIPVGGFVLNQQASMDPKNAPLVAAAPQTYNAGGPTIDAMLTPKETIFGPGIRKNPELYSAVAAANNGYALGGNILPMKKNYGKFASSLSKMITSGKGKDAILNYQEGIVLKAGTARASAKVIDELTGTPLPKGATYDKYGHIITKDGTRIPGKIAKPATGLLSDEESFNKYNKILSGLKGLKGKDVTGYLRGLLRFGGGRVVGSTSQLLRSIPENILDRKIVDEIEKKISSEYVRRVTRMKREGVGLTDANNPYHDISSSVLEEYFDNIPALRGIWNQWKVKTSATNKHYFNEMVKGRGASTNELIDLQVFGPNGEVIPVGPLKGADGSKIYHAANKDWEENLLGYNMGGGIIDSKRKNYGVKSLPTSVINKLTAKWRPQQQFRAPGYQYTLGNQDPLHGPLQIGRTMVPKNRQDELDWQREIVYKDDRFARNAVLQQFPIGSLEDRGKYILRQYMSGNYEPMEAKGSYEALRSLSKKYRGKLYRGILLGKTAGKRVSPLPQEIQDAIQLAQTTGDTSGLIGKEFIMRRSSWSKNRSVASYFAPGFEAPGQRSILIEANVNNRNVIPAGDMFPDVRFPAPYGQKRANWPEEEAIFGGKFRIIGFEKGKLQVETIVDGARAMGGPVNSNKSYIVGEKGPELFVPKVNGSIVPNYALGGDIKSGKSAYGEQPTGLNMKRQMGMSLLSMIPGYAGFSIGQKLTGGNMMGGMAGGLAGDILGTALLNKFMFSADGATKKVSLLTKSWQLFTKLPGPLKIVGAVAAVAGSIKLINDKIMEHRRIINLAFGQTADTAKKIGDNFQFKSLADQLKEARSELKAFNDSMTIAGSADKKVNLGQLMFKAEDIKKEIQKVKKDLPELVDVFDKAQPDEVLVKAEQLKAQFIAGGMSSENATKKIYALIAASNDANLALSTVANAGFQAITDKSTATNKSLETFNELLVAGNTDQIYAAFETANISAQSLEASLVGTKNAQGEIITEAQAYEEAYNRIAASASGNKEIGEATLRAFISQNKELEKILNATDTMEGAYAKLKLYSLGIREDLVAMNSELAEALALVATQQAGILGSSTGPFKELVNLIAKKDAASKASAATAKKLATATKDQIQAEIDKRKENIDAIKKEADERKNALDEELSDSDKLIAIQKAQIEYQNAIASGDFTTAAQAQLDIQSLVQEQQIELAKRAIDANAESRMAPEEARIKALEGQLKELDGQIASANEAASKTMDNVNKLRETLSGLITFTISATADGVIDASEAGVLRGIQASLKNLGLDKLAGSLGLQVTEYGKNMKGAPGPSDLNNIYEYGILKKGVDSFTAAFNSVKEGANLRVNVKNIDELKSALGGDKTQSVNPMTLLPGTSIVGTATGGLNDAAAKAKPGIFKYKGKEYNKEVTGTGFYGTGMEDRKFWYIQKADGGYIKNFAPGGGVSGPGTATSDSIPAMLSDGEYVFSARAVDNAGGPDAVDFLHNALKRAEGGKIASWMKPKSSYNSKNQPTGNPRGRYWGELERLYQQSPLGFDKNGKPIFNNAGKDPWGGTEIPGLPFSGKVANFSDYFHQLAEQPKKSSGPLMGLDKSPDRYAGSGASMGGIGSGAYGMINSLFMHKGGAVGHKHNSGGNAMPNAFGMGMDLFGKTLFNAGNSVVKNLLGFDITTPFNKKSKMELFSMAMLPLGGGGLGGSSKIAGRGAALAAPHINPVKASTQIMRNLNGSMLESAVSQGRRVPTVVPDNWWANEANPTPYLEQFKDMFRGTNEMNPLLMASDYGAGFRKYWGRAYDSLVKSKDPALDGIKNVDEFFRSIAEKAPGWGSRYSEDATHPLVEAANKAVMGAHGLAADQPIALFKAARQAGTAGYTSISSKFARAYLNGPHLGVYRDAAEGTEAGLYKIITEAKKLKDPLGLGGIFDEFANVIPQSLNNAVKIGSGATRKNQGYGRITNLTDFYSSLGLGKRGMLGNSTEELEKILSKIDPEVLASKMKLPKFAGGGLISTILSKAKSLAHKPINLINQYMNYFKAKAMVKKGVFHGSADLGSGKDAPFSGVTELRGDYARDPYHGMGFYGTTSKAEADLYAGGYNAPGQWGESYGSLNKVTKIPFGKYLDFSKDLKNQNYALWKLFGDQGFMGAQENLGSIMNSAGMTGSIMPRISSGLAPDDINLAKWLALNKPKGTVLQELGLGFANGGMVGPKYNVPSTSSSIVNPQPMRYNNGGAVHRYDVGGLVVNAAPGQSEREIASMVVQMLDNKNMLESAKSGGRGRT
jgi:TP901 family phage tail tape measure protein